MRQVAISTGITDIDPMGVGHEVKVCPPVIFPPILTSVFEWSMTAPATAQVRVEEAWHRYEAYISSSPLSSSGRLTLTSG